ncbi:hypothetical protein ACHHYP_10020 [Achlya hypogyna]|uniref:PROP1-like PPR domain-containing protein n=1 Tax=Achlya hypogyna TaxID=1202772 RepID=A0A1V9ZII8_ACHHY|nr:hypothetical protein ACHHYP_10020 [Achlya hypogyna]
MQWPRRSFSLLRAHGIVRQLSQKSRRFMPEVHYMLRRQKASLEETFAVLRERTAPYDIKGCDTFYFFCLQATPLEPAFVTDIAAFFRRVLEEDAQGPHDGAFSSMVAILTQTGRADVAVEFLKRKHEKNPSAQPHYRSYAPLLEHYIQANELEKAWAFWKYIQSIGTTQPADKVGPTLVSFASAALGTDIALFREVLGVLRELRYQLTPEDVALWLSATEQHGDWTTTQLAHAAMLPACQKCSTPLTKLPVSTAELDQLLAAVETMCIESTSGSLSATPRQVPPGKKHYILDGPNIAYLNQNFEGGAFRFDYVDQLVKQIEADGHVVSVTMPAYYFEEVSYLSVKTAARNPYKKTGTRYYRTRTAEDKAFIDAWEAASLAFRARREVASDDLYWMYGTFYLLAMDAKAGIETTRVNVVSNDEIKDHIVALDEQHGVSRDLIERWKGTARVGVSLGFVARKVAHIRLHDPLPFSRVAQDHGDSFHLPIADSGSWLCISRP